MTSRALAPESLRPKEPRNLLLALGAAVLLLLLGAAAALVQAGWSPKHGAGLLFGVLASLLFVFESLYPFRRLRARPGARAWLQGHVYLGALALLAVLLHTGFALPHGWMGWALLLLSAWTTLTGLLGVLIQKRLPAALAEGLNVEAVYERIPELLDQLRAEADMLMEGVSEGLETFYLSEVRGRLEALEPSWAYLLDVRAGRDDMQESFRRRVPFFEPEEQPKVWDLMRILGDKLELDAQYRVQSVLRHWLGWSLHVPAAGLLMGLLVVHVAAWILY